jgi:Cu+-exporting ATPase
MVKVFQVKGMSCTGCSARLARVISKMPGVSKAQVDFETARMTVEYDETSTDVQKIVDMTEETGYEAVLA